MGSHTSGGSAQSLAFFEALCWVGVLTPKPAGWREAREGTLHPQSRASPGRVESGYPELAC